MNNKQKFESFLESLKGNGHDVLIESVKKGFQTCFKETVSKFEALGAIPEGRNKVKLEFSRTGPSILNFKLVSADSGEEVAGPFSLDTTDPYAKLSKEIVDFALENDMEIINYEEMERQDLGKANRHLNLRYDNGDY